MEAKATGEIMAAAVEDKQLQPDSFFSNGLWQALTPEIDLGYERLYAYLQNDVSKKRPIVELVLNLLSPCKETNRAPQSM